MFSTQLCQTGINIIAFLRSITELWQCRNSTIEDPFLLPAVELLLRINSTQPFTTSMNTTQDFSYINTSRSAVPITNATTIIPRQAQANPKLPAYIAGDVVWGTKPIMVGRLKLAKLLGWGSNKSLGSWSMSISMLQLSCTLHAGMPCVCNALAWDPEIGYPLFVSLYAEENSKLIKQEHNSY